MRAKVTEHMTGAIADSINYTIDEMRRLVAGINTAAQQVNVATQEAHTVSTQLLHAAQKQASEIQTTGQSVAQMAQSMNRVSTNADDSAKGIEEVNLLPDGIPVMEESFRHGCANDDNGIIAELIIRREFAAFEDRYAHRLKVTGADGPPAGNRCIATQLLPVFRKYESRFRIGFASRQHRRISRIRDARQ